jgi:hypothetical protein
MIIDARTSSRTFHQSKGTGHHNKQHKTMATRSCAWFDFLNDDLSDGPLVSAYSDSDLSDSSIVNNSDLCGISNEQEELPESLHPGCGEETAEDDGKNPWQSTQDRLLTSCRSSAMRQHEEDENCNDMQAISCYPLTWCPHAKNEDYVEECIYSKHAPHTSSSIESHARECKKVISEAFSSCVNGLKDTSQCSIAKVIEIVSTASNYEVQDVTRIQNRPLQGIHSDFKRRYSIKNERTVFHGTTHDVALSISKSGFLGAASKRSKFGKGIYVSSNAWEALAYAEPDKSLQQTLLVVNLLQGPTALGHQDQVDFGFDQDGKQILTLTNPENTIFCASRDSQLSAHYRITVRYLSCRSHTAAQQSVVKIYHPTVWRTIKGLGFSSCPPALAAPPAKFVLQSFSGFYVGDKVKIVNPFKTHSFCHDQEGTIKQIVKGHASHFYIEMTNPEQSARVELANQNKRLLHAQEKTWLRCKISQLRKIQPTPKRQEDGAGLQPTPKRQKTVPASDSVMPAAAAVGDMVTAGKDSDTTPSAAFPGADVSCCSDSLACCADSCSVSVLGKRSAEQRDGWIDPTTRVPGAFWT